MSKQSNKLKQILVNLLIFIFLIPLFFQPFETKAMNKEEVDKYPHLANYFLKWTISEEEAKQLAKWDVIILDMEVQENSRDNLKKIRQYNPDIIILAYITSQEIKKDISQNDQAKMRGKLLDNIVDGWWLTDNSGKKLSFWPNTWLLNLTDGADEINGYRWNTFLSKFVYQEILSTGLWDGVFYDNIWRDVSWINQSNLDIYRDNKIRKPDEIDQQWIVGVKKIIKSARDFVGNNFIIVSNGSSFDEYQQYLNGVMFETFPTPWEGDGSWQASMKQYLKNLPEKNKSPQIYILNVNTNNTGVMDNYRKVRFGLASTLLGDGYFSFDSGDQDHSQVWWYDEYDAKLGKAKSGAYNLLDKNNKTIKPGLWRRDFSNGITVVNSTGKEQKYSFPREEFEKINGVQDRRVNDGSKVNWVKIASNDGIVLFKINIEIKNSSFKNGNFVRVLNSKGEQTRNGFFSYNDNFLGNAQILILDKENSLYPINTQILVSEKGVINMYNNGIKIVGFAPYGALFKNEISFTVVDLNNNGTKEIITAPASGSSHVKIFSKDGKQLSPGWFAYDKNFRKGVNIATADLNNDGSVEIITAPASGSSHVKIFSKDGKQLSPGWFAYDKNFRGGVSIATADLNNDGSMEIISVPASGSAHVKIFSKDGKLLGQFFAYDKSFRNKIKVIADDINNDGKSDILVSTESFAN
ncbi:MAG: putative glycoside hydrolase [Patescibacteria group bacterium]